MVQGYKLFLSRTGILHVKCLLKYFIEKLELAATTKGTQIYFSMLAIAHVSRAQNVCYHVCVFVDIVLYLVKVYN